MEQPPSCGHGVLHPRYYESIGTRSSKPPRGSRVVVLPGSRVWRRCHWGGELVLVSACFTVTPLITEGQAHTHTTTPPTIHPLGAAPPPAIAAVASTAFVPTHRRRCCYLRCRCPHCRPCRRPRRRPRFKVSNSQSEDTGCGLVTFGREHAAGLNGWCLSLQSVLVWQFRRVVLAILVHTTHQNMEINAT